MIKKKCAYAYTYIMYICTHMEHFWPLPNVLSCDLKNKNNTALVAHVSRSEAWCEMLAGTSGEFPMKYIYINVYGIWHARDGSEQESNIPTEFLLNTYVK